MLRDFPELFGYPLPENWPGMDSTERWPEVVSWEGFSHLLKYGHDCSIEDYRNKSRGFRVVLRTLAENQHHITEFVMETHHRCTGISCAIFGQPGQVADDLAALLSTPGFRRLDLALFTGARELENWSDFRTGSLRQVLAGAPQLEHISFSCITVVDPNGYTVRYNWSDPQDESLAIPLQTICPVEAWPKLQHLGINQLPVKQSQLVSLLAALPDSLRSVKLSHPAFVEEGNS